jgi:hypothetical protein
MKFLFEKLCEGEIEKGGWKCVRGKGPEAFDILWARGVENYVGATQEALIKRRKIKVGARPDGSYSSFLRQCVRSEVPVLHLQEMCANIKCKSASSFSVEQI